MGSGSAGGKGLIKSQVQNFDHSYILVEKIKIILGCMNTLFKTKKVSLLCCSKALMLRSGS